MVNEFLSGAGGHRSWQMGFDNARSVFTLTVGHHILWRVIVTQKRIRITASPVIMEADLNSSKTAQLIWDALPIEARGNTWGDEIYFSIPVETGAEHPQELVELGALAYWPPGTAFCIFFGPTPMSRGNEIRPASAVNVIGRLIGAPKAFKQVKNGTVVRIEKVAE